MWLANAGDPSALWGLWVAERRGLQAADTESPPLGAGMKSRVAGAGD